MQDITHLPMGLMWQMPIPVACSLAVAAQGLAVSCGQCPLDTKGQVLHPGDAGAQAGLVAGMVQGVLSHLPGHYPAILVVYHDAADESEVLGPLRRVFPDAVLLPVRLPHHRGRRRVSRQSSPPSHPNRPAFCAAVHHHP